MTAAEVINSLDNSNDGFYRHFVSLGHGYSYLLDVRMNLFRDGNGSWAIAIERLGDNPRAGGIVLEVFYYGNCLINLEQYNNRLSNIRTLYPVDSDSYQSAFDENGTLKSDAGHWTVRGKKVPLKFSTAEFADAGITLKESDNGNFSPEQTARVVVKNNRELFRATDRELYNCIPHSLEKIMVIDEWFHKDFVLQQAPAMSEEALRTTFEFNKNLTGLSGMTFEQFAASFRQQQLMSDEWNRKQWEDNRPGAYETWQQIACVLEANDSSLYKPSLPANTHWSHWPESGNL